MEFATGHRATTVASDDHPHLDHIAESAVYQLLFQVQYQVEAPGAFQMVTGPVLCATRYCLPDKTADDSSLSSMSTNFHTF